MNDFILLQNIKMLEIIAELGHFKNRIYISDRIDTLSKENKIRLIKILFNDKIEIISRGAIDKSMKLSFPKNIRIQITEKLEYWKEKKNEQSLNSKRVSELLKGSTNQKRKFTNGETFSKTKEMLKKPMNTGKWM